MDPAAAERAMKLLREKQGGPRASSDQQIVSIPDAGHYVFMDQPVSGSCADSMWMLAAIISIVHACILYHECHSVTMPIQHVFHACCCSAKYCSILLSMPHATLIGSA